MRPWKRDRIRISFFCYSVDLRPSRIPKTDCPRDLIEGFPGRIVSCTPDNVKFSVILYSHKMCVSP